ncbi:MAG TPA: ABC transporter permease [Phycisphaerales bacterium]|nr:ABC transporter permease [Phycisphaerales bacterium]HMP36484.1 ABC transporter permease [Phycisphaerales bacterium]
MIAPRYMPLIAKQLWRHRLRSALVLAGVAIAMFLFVAVQALQEGVRRATQAVAEDTTLVVYRANRFCPATSRLPQSYRARIVRIPGVAAAVPVKVAVSNCRAALDVITFRGVPREDVVAEHGGLAASWRVLEGSIGDWERRSDAALVGEALAARRRLRVGDSFDSSGVTVTVAGIIRSREAQDDNVAYVHLEFLQQATAARTVEGGLGVVTQFLVRVAEPALLSAVADAIDEEFRSDAEPTTTRPERAFVAQAGADIVEIVTFTRWVGWGALVAVLALVGNAIVLGVQDRIREHAVLQTLGFRSSLVTRLVIGEGILIAAVGGAVGTGAALLLVHLGNFSLSQEGVTIGVAASWSLVAWGLALSAGAGIVAAVVPAWRAGRREIASCFRAV